MTDILWATRTYRHHSSKVSSQRLVNGYAEIEPPDAKTSVTILGTPGVDTWADVGTGPIRAAAEIAGTLYVVSGEQFYEVDENGSPTLRSGANAIDGNAVVGIANNDLEIVITDGTKGWSYVDSTNTFAEITDADFTDTARTVDYIDGYFLFDKPNSNEFFLSDLLDGTAYSALDYANAESSSDLIRAVKNDDGLAAIFGEKTIEYWQHTGALSFPFQLIKPTVRRGLAASQAIASEGNALYFLGNDKAFYQISKGALRRLSDPGLTNAWEGYSRVDDAFCFPWSHDGHKFIVITFPSGNATFVYDILTNLWHERVTHDSGGNEVRWRANCAIDCYDMTLIGDSLSGKIGRIEHDTYTEFDGTTRMVMISPPLHGDGNRVAMPFFQLDMETGVGNAYASDPEVIFDWSDDGGATWVTPQETASLGAVGARTTRLQWDRLGSFYERSLRIQITDPVKRVVLGARCPGLEIIEM